MDIMAYTPPSPGPRCSKSNRPRKGHTLSYGINYALPPIGESANDSRDTLSGREDVPEVPLLHSQSVLGKPEDLAVEPAALETVKQGPGILPPTVPATMASATTTTTITTGPIPSRASTECALAALSSRLGQQGEERAKDRC